MKNSSLSKIARLGLALSLAAPAAAQVRGVRVVTAAPGLGATALPVLPAAALPAAPALAAPGLTVPALTAPALIAPALTPAAAAPAASPAAALSAVSKAVEALPDLGKASAGQSAASGRELEAAMTGDALARVSGAVSAASAENRDGARLVPGAALTPSNAFSGAANPELAQKIAEKAAVIQQIRDEVGKVIVGQKEMLDSIITGLIAGEHVLLEGVPGVAKTQTVKAFSGAIEGGFQRIQGTPDKLPSDILGAEIMQDDPKTGAKAVVLERGPVFTNILLVDEINRMMPKTQAALLEAMAEGRVTVGRQTLDLPKSFMVLATQNPIEQEGTYRLPEAQQDRFMFKVIVERPDMLELKEIMDRFSTKDAQPKAGRVSNLDEMMEMRRLSEQVHVDDAIKNYIVNIVEATHSPKKYGVEGESMIDAGASPRAAIFLLKAAKIHAFLDGRAYVTPADVKAVAHRILRHRLMLNYQAQNLTTDQVVDAILSKVGVPKPQAPRVVPSLTK